MMKLLILGLDRAGKTTILSRVKDKTEKRRVAPTIGFNVEAITCQSMNFAVFDTGGAEEFRCQSTKYYPGTNGFIYVIDSSDKKRLTSSAVELTRAVSSTHLKDVPLLVFSNKVDLPGHLSVEEITEALDLESLSQPWYVCETGNSSLEGAFDGMAWLCKQIRTYKLVEVGPAQVDDVKLSMT